MHFDIALQRFALTPYGSYGLVTVPELKFQCYSVEQPWALNKPFKSCVPFGEYELIPHAGAPRKGHWVMINEDLNVYDNQADIPALPKDRGRFKCLFGDIANAPSDVQGCVGLGDGLGYTKKQWSVMNSGRTKAEFDALFAADATLMILITRFDSHWKEQRDDGSI